MTINKEILEIGDVAKAIISFIRDCRNKNNVPKEKLVLYIDTYSKEPHSKDFYLFKCENIFSKENVGNISKVEYDLTSLIENGHYFEYDNIFGYDVYIPFPMVHKKNDDVYSAEISRIEKQLSISKGKLCNISFLAKADALVIEKERKKIFDFEKKMLFFKNIRLFINAGKDYYECLCYFYNNPDMIMHIIQYEREKRTTKEEYSKEWFSEIYEADITAGEIRELNQNKRQRAI